MLEGLDSIHWSRYYHAYGSADDIPGLVRAFTSPDSELRGRACYDLMNRLAHQGTRWEASHLAIPFLCELVKEPSTPDRSSVMMCMLRIALGDSWLDESTLPYPPSRFAVVDGMDAEAYHSITAALYDAGVEGSEADTAIIEMLGIVWERDSYTAMSRNARALLTIALDDDPTVARYAIASVPWFPDIHRYALSVLIELIATHPVPTTRATAALTAGLLHMPDHHLITTIEHHTLDPSQPHLLQLAGAIALAFLKGADVEARVLDILVDAEDWRDEIDAVGDGIPYPRALMGFRSKALSRLGL